jgi:alpha-beta hydrolase superfamily lysophospholipase
MAKESFILTDGDGNTLNAYRWIPDKEPEAIMAIIHGLSDHIDRFDNFSNFLNKNRIATIGMDYQGHGKSPGRRGHVRSYELLLSSVENLLIEARLIFTDLPLFLYGHSFGGNIAANYILRHQSKEIAGTIISSPYFELAFTPPKWKMISAMVLGKLIPSLTFSNEVDPMDLSHDPVIGKSYFEDPLVHGKVSIGLYNSATSRGRWALENAHLLGYPTLIMHGDEDQLTSCKASERFAEQAGKYANLKIWKGLRHELHNETNKDEVLTFMCEWIKKRI